MFFQFKRIWALTRHLAVASVSLLLAMSAVGYVLSPVEEAIGASVRAIPAKPNHEGIEGKVQSNRTRGIVIRVLRRVNGHVIEIALLRLVHGGYFGVSVHPGNYEVVISKGDHRVTEPVKVTRGHTEFIAIKIFWKRYGFGIAPVIFNY